MPFRKRSAVLNRISAKYGLPIVIFGHAGDGNLHPNILFDKRNPVEWEKVEQMVAEEFNLALELNGTLSGEHGVGTLKRPYMERALGMVSLALQKRIKNVFDPNNILNPGKVFPDEILTKIGNQTPLVKGVIK